MKLKHNNKGFSLVELIVVIAIMAILGGVGTVGYTKYIEQTNKKADIATVGNVMRAIDTGAYSTMFTPPESLSLSATTYPIGFVVLSSEGNVQAIQSGTEIDYHDGDCVEKTITYNFITKSYDGMFIKKEKYSRKEMSVSYCSTHTINMPIKTDSKTTFGSGRNKVELSANSYYFLGTEDEASISKYGQTYFATFANGSSACNKENVTLNPTYATDNKLNTSGELHNALVASYGDDYASQMVLKYDKWGIDEKEIQNFPSFLAGADKFMDKVKALSTTFTDLSSAIIANGLESTLTTLGMGQYTNSEGLINVFAVKTVELGNSSATLSDGTETNAFMKEWLEVPTNVEGWDSNNMGYANREFYSAARQSYNSSFASWLTSNGYSSYAPVIEDYSKPMSDSDTVSGALSLIELTLGVEVPETLPALICPTAFTDSNSGLLNQFTAAGLTSDDLSKCSKLYDSYVSSGAAEENGKVFLDTMKTVVDTFDEASGSDTNGFFEYYDSYLNEMSSLYDAASTYARNGQSSIIIIVEMKDGIIEYTVSPSAANPRNK